MRSLEELRELISEYTKHPDVLHQVLLEQVRLRDEILENPLVAAVVQLERRVKELEIAEEESHGRI